jgi:hypothetical protein|nr:RING finger protein [Ruminococcus bromii]
MEFTEYKCPVCGEQFKTGDDVVVCPECGAPHHRECYEKEGHCHFADRHGDDFSFEKEQVEEADKQAEQNDENGTVTCKRCGTENPKELFYCSNCGAPLYGNNEEAQNFGQNQNNGQPNPNFNQNQGMPPFGVPFGQANPQMAAAFDPMAGMKSDEPLVDDITAGEAAKFIGKNTPYYLRVFSFIKKFKKSRFNFTAFILSGIYFLYRKMYALGILFSVLTFGSTIASGYIRTLPAWQNIYNNLLQAQKTGQIVSFTNNFGLSTEDFLLFISPLIANVISMAVMVICGLIANKCYYNHSIKKIKKIKSTTDKELLTEALETKGGVNLPLAISIVVALIIANYLPIFFM